MKHFIIFSISFFIFFFKNEIYCQHYEPEIEDLLTTSQLIDLMKRDSIIHDKLEFKIPIYDPLSKIRLTSNFGNRIHPIYRKIKFHNGIDISANYKQPAYATADGQVIDLGYQTGLGNFVRIKHLLGFETVYGHLDSFSTELYANVYQGQTIGFCGSTGNSTGVHLHYSVLRFKGYLNPLILIAD